MFHWYRAGLIFLLALMLATGIVFFKTTRKFTEVLDAGAFKTETLASVGHLRLLVQEMEMARMIPETMADNSSPNRFDSAFKKAYAEIDNLAKRLADSPIQKERIALIDALMKAKAPQNFGSIKTIIRRVEEDESIAAAAWRDDLWNSTRIPAAAATVMILSGIGAAILAYLLMLMEFARRRATERLLKESRTKFSTLAEGAKEYALAVLDSAGRIADWNEGAKRLLGYNASEIRHKSFARLFSKEQSSLQYPEQRLEAAARDGQSREEGLRVRRDGSTFPVREVIHALYDDNKLSGYAVVFQDITEELRSQEELTKLSLSLEQSTELVAIAGGDGFIEFVNQALLNVTGYTRNELLGRSLEVLGPASPVGPANGSDPSTDKDIGRPVLLRRKKNGEPYYVTETVTPVVNPSGTRTHLVITARDVTGQRNLEARISFLAQHDPLTGFFNRYNFQDRIKLELNQMVSSHTGCSVLIICIDRFKHINDVYGNNEGNLVLKQVAECLQEALGSKSVIGRLGSDEFGLILRNISGQNDVDEAVRSIKETVSRKVNLNGRKLFLTISVGSALCPADGSDADTLLKCADMALDHARSSGLNQSRRYSSEINERISSHFAMEQRLFGALPNNEYMVAYQPYFDLTDRKIAGAEALIRWINRELGTVPPSKFIKVLEATDMIIDVGAWVLKAACLQAKKIGTASFGFPISVNLSPSQFRHSGLVPMIKETIGQANIDPQQLAVEVTESVFVEDLGFAQSVLKQLKDIGVSISIDDFGTGYSSLSYLKKLPVDAVKIDQSFVRDITDDPDAASIVTSMTSMARSLGLKTIAEGVETEEQWKVLRLLRCDMGQGFIFSPALNVRDFEQSLA